jgi:hypothetical protein
MNLKILRSKSIDLRSKNFKILDLRILKIYIQEFQYLRSNNILPYIEHFFSHYTRFHHYLIMITDWKKLVDSANT